MKKFSIFVSIVCCCIAIYIYYDDTVVSDTISYIQNAKFFGSEELPSELTGSGTPLQGEETKEVLNTGEEYNFDTTVYPYYGLLSTEEQKVYKQVYANAIAINESFALVNEITVEELANVMASVYNDHPELFWLETAYAYNYAAGTSEVSSVTISFYDLVDDLENNKAVFDSVVNTIVTGAACFESDMEKELYVHDAICNLATYNESADLNQSAYSALVSGETVCAGYARAYQYVLQQAGLIAYYCTGTADGGSHAWNIVAVSGAFYNVDLSWDDSISESYGLAVYPYFNLTDEELSSDHIRTGLSISLPTCTATDMSYTNVYGATLSVSDITVSDKGHMSEDISINPPAEKPIDWMEQPRNTMAPNKQSEFEAPSDMPMNNQMTSEAPQENEIEKSSTSGAENQEEQEMVKPQGNETQPKREMSTGPNPNQYVNQ